MNTFPREWKEFAKWRKEQHFPFDMELRALRVENDLRLLPQLSLSVNPQTIAAVNRNIADFEMRLKEQG